MSKKVMKGLPKRIAACMMAVLMMLSLMPINQSVVLAAEQTYEFTVKNSEDEVITDATFLFYDGESNVIELTDGSVAYDEGTQKYTLTYDFAGVSNPTVVISAAGCASSAPVSIVEDTLTYDVSLTTYAEVSVTGTIVLPTTPDVGDTDAYAGIYVALLDSEGNEIDANVDSANGTYMFASVPVGKEYTLKISSEKNVYATKSSQINLVRPVSDTVVVGEDNNTMTANSEVVLSFDESQIFEVYKNGTTRRFEPTVKLGDEVLDTGYIITYSTTAEGITVTNDGHDLIVEAGDNASVGTIIVSAELVDDDGVGYVTTLEEIEIEVKEKDFYSPFNFTNPVLTDGGVADIDFTDDVDYRYDVTTNLEDSDDLEVVYSVDDTSVAEIDSETGEITVKSVGTVNVTATLQARDSVDYKETTISFILNINKIDQEYDVTFSSDDLEPNGGEVLYVFEENNNTHSFAAESADPSGEVSITYSVSYKDQGVDKDAEETGLVTIDANGDVTFLQEGEYIVTATASKPNYNDKKVSYTVEILREEIKVAFDNNSDKNEVDGIKYYDNIRNATITIVSKDFNSNNAVISVNGQATEVVWNGQSAVVEFTTNGQNSLSVEYTNAMGNALPAYTETFWIDTDMPTGSASLEETPEATVWEQLIETLTFGIWKKTTATVTATANTDTTAVTMQYYISNTDTILTIDALNALAENEWIDYISGEEISLTSENIYAVYFKLTDVVGHVTYLSTDGFIVDMNGSTIAITPVEQANANGYYNDDVELNVTVQENTATYSGINKVTYEVLNNGNVTQSGTLLEEFSKEDPVYTDLVELIQNEVIVVDAELNNSDNVVVKVTALDNAGNETTEEYALKINATKPLVAINYDNNNSTGYDGLTYYFDAVRTATVTITDKAETFDATAATNAISVVLKDKAGTIVADNGVTISSWTSEDDKHTATVAFTKDGDYTVDVNYMNKASSSNVNISPAQSTIGALHFVIDTTDPINVSVSALSNAWDELLETITFGLYTAEDVVLTIAGEDATSAVTREFYIANDGLAMDENDLALISDDLWIEYSEDTRTITNEQQMVVFVRVTDQAGNRVYVNSNGIVYDKTAAGITLTPETANSNGVYNSDVDVTITVDDAVSTSGITSVKYWITCDGATTTVPTTLEITETNSIKRNGLVQKFVETITVDAETNNSSNVVVYVEVTDQVGNTDTKSVALDIDITAPTIEVSYDNNTTIENGVIDGKGYFTTSRTATIVLTERTAHFDKTAFMNAIAITAQDSNGYDISSAMPTITFEGTDEVGTADEAKHTFTVVYSADANYTLKINYTDKAGLTCADSDVDYDDASVTPKNFSIDTTAPTGKITVGSLGFWNTLLENFTFGVWSPSDVNILITAEDATSPIKSVQYYKTSTFTAMTVAELDAVTSWVSGKSFTVSNDDIFVVYAKIVDQTGYVTYISSNGIIVDETTPVVETLSPEITITPERPVNGIYDGNVRVDVGVKDSVSNNSYAGLKEIRYEVTNMGTKTQEGTLYSFSEKNPTKDKLLQTWNGQDIVVDAAKNNSNEVEVKVIAIDNAGNRGIATTKLKIDTTKPVIEVSYDNNNGDNTFGDSVYYNANRVATIKVIERNFDANAVKVTITNTDGTVPTLSNWTTVAGTGNGDNTVNVATVVYSADGDYTFAISAKDKVGLANNGVNYGASQAPTAFTIDKTAPVISIAYDNNDFTNENYYKADRIATITIKEHNFDASRVDAIITATDNGQSVSTPAISNWNKSGDTYTATVNYSTDALYTFDISFADKAGNNIPDFAEQSFYVDKTMPQMSITEIVDQSANSSDKIGFVITATDTNFDVFAPVLTAVVKTETGFTTQELNIASILDITNGQVYTISNIDVDGIYRITCTLVDKAGNAFTDVTLHRADGTAYVENRTAEDTLLTFSVNRDGSVFEVDDATGEVLNNYYVYDVTDDVVIVEVNANRLTEQSITLNGEALVEGTDYTITTEGGNGEWMRYIYTLNKELFVEEGEYTIVVSSVDEAENNAFSDVKDVKVAFVVDRTAPVITISGLENGGRYQTDKQTVTLIPTDDGGAIKSIVINQVDKDGKVIKVLHEELSGDALAEALEANDGQLTFDIPSGEYEFIEIVCNDCSVNADGTTNTSRILIENVLISADAFTIFWSTYQYAVIGGAAAAVAVPTGIVLFKKRIKK